MKRRIEVILGNRKDPIADLRYDRSGGREHTAFADAFDVDR